jgi:hypothetical protein
MTRVVRILFACFCTVAAVTAPSAQSGRRTGQSGLEGRVVDAACYLMHPHAASGKTHDECGTACAKRGVPLGVVNEADGKLYLDLEARKQLLAHLHERVRVLGSTEKRQGPLRLELPVSDTNTMTVQLEGEYYVVSISNIAKAPDQHKSDRR